MRALFTPSRLRGPNRPSSKSTGRVVRKSLYTGQVVDNSPIDSRAMIHTPLVHTEHTGAISKPAQPIKNTWDKPLPYRGLTPQKHGYL